MKANKSHPERNTFREILNKCSPADFDGHTEFQRVTPEERLDALASLARFVYINKGRVGQKK